MFKAFSIPFRFPKKDDAVYKKLASEYISSDLNFADLSKKYGIGSVQKALDKAVQKGWMTQEKRDVASNKRKNAALEKKRDNRGMFNEKELSEIAHDYINTNISNSDLQEKYGTKHIWHMVKRATKKGIVTEEEWSNAAERRRQSVLKENRKKAEGLEFTEERKKQMSISRNGESNHFYGKIHTDKTKKIISENNSKYSLEDISSLALDYVYFNDSFDELKENHKVKDMGHLMRRAISHGIITKEQYHEAFARKASERYIDNPRLQEAARQSGLRLAGTDRERTCMLNGTKYDSKGEAATGELLKKYVPSFDLVKGKTFQANGDVNCVFDFVLPQAIIEWHPINWLYDVTKEDKSTYKELREQGNGEEQAILRQLLKEHKYDLGVNYWMKRQEASDNSQIYQGKEVILARDFNELYGDVLSKYGRDLPSKKELKREFNSYKQRAELVKSKESTAQ